MFSRDEMTTARIALEAELRGFVAANSNPPYQRSAAVAVLDVPGLEMLVEPDAVRPAASTVKVLAAIALYEAAARGEIDVDGEVPLAELGTTAYPSIMQVFDPKRSLTVREICALSLVTSDNPAAEYVRGLVGQARIDGVISELGLAGTSFAVGFTDRDFGARGRLNTTTARDALAVVTHLATAAGLGELRHFLTNNLRNNRIPLRLDDDVPVMHKTGNLDGVANDMGVVTHPEAGRVAFVFLSDEQADKTVTDVEIGGTVVRVLGFLAGLRGDRA